MEGVMQGLLSLVSVAFLALTLSAECAEVPRIPDAEEFSREVLSAISHNELRKVGEMIADKVGRQDAAATLLSALQPLEGKTLDFTKKVIDKDFDGALRQIVYYSYVPNIGFVYFRFNFKMTSTGWILTNFTYKSETQELFPKDFVER
jgi:hypothetical protein